MIFILTLILISLGGVLLFGVLFLIYILLYSLFFGAPYAAVGTQRLTTMIDLLQLKSGEKFADLGAGDGRLVIAAAKKGAIAHGYEINPVLFLIARRNIQKENLPTAHIHWQSYWDIHFREFDAIAVYGIGHIMKKLERKIQAEGKRGLKVVSNHFPFPTWKEDKRRSDVYRYTK